MKSDERIQSHYGLDDLRARVAGALEQAGKATGPLTRSDLEALDQFHVRALEATEELGRAMDLSKGASVLDVGCGLGGPARYLAEMYGSRVTGIDLSGPFVAVAGMLAERTGTSDRATFVQGDALDLPFPDASFDHAWTQHVAMNISDRGALYRGIHRVVRAGGLFAIYDVIEGDGRPLRFPVPWSSDPETSFLLNEHEMKEALQGEGFTEVSWQDATDAGLAWFAREKVTMSLRGDNDRLGLSLVMGPEFKGMAANFALNLREGRARLVQAVYRRD